MPERVCAAVRKRKLERLIHALRRQPASTDALPLNIDDDSPSFAGQHCYVFSPRIYRVFMLRDQTASGYRGCDETLFYPFRAEDVALMMTARGGGERGIWYRLRDGRVFDEKGRACNPRHLKAVE